VHSFAQSLTVIDGVPPLEDMQRWSACGAAADEERLGGVGQRAVLGFRCHTNEGCMCS